MLLRLDWRSRVVWKLDVSAHHDLAVWNDGRIHVLTDGLRTTDVDGESVTFQDNYVVTVTPEGEIVRRISLFDAFGEEAHTGALKRLLTRVKPAQQQRLARLRAAAEPGHAEDEQLVALYEEAIGGETTLHSDVKNILFHGRDADIFHTNSIEVLDPPKHDLWSAGDLLLSIRSLNRIAVLDPRAERVIWSWGEGVLQAQHDARALADGTILLFDNGPRRKYSRIVKIDPRTRQIVWEYLADPPESFFSSGASGAQPLPNGNLLITETDKGHAFETTPGGEIAWEYYSHVLRSENKAPEKEGVESERIEREALEQGAKTRVQADLPVLRGAIYRMARTEFAAVEELIRSPQRD